MNDLDHSALAQMEWKLEKLEIR